jgi:hypothetical protein
MGRRKIVVKPATVPISREVFEIMVAQVADGVINNWHAQKNEIVAREKFDVSTTEIFWVLFALLICILVPMVIMSHPIVFGLVIFCCGTIERDAILARLRQYIRHCSDNETPIVRNS